MLKKIFFVSRAFPFSLVIYPGSGPEFGEAYGWEVRYLDEMARTTCDIGIVENRLREGDLDILEHFLSAPSGVRYPIFFKVSDPDMPASPHRSTRYVFEQKDRPGVHYLSVYDPIGPAGDFFASLSASRVVRAPFPYDVRREVDRPIAGRSRQVFVSGARSRRLYPFRESVFRRFTINPIARSALARLPHPGYPDIGGTLRHTVIRDKYVEYAAHYTHFLLDPSRYGVELMKYTECAYAGSVPVGMIPRSLSSTVAHCFLGSNCRTLELLRTVRMPIDEMEAIANAYRGALRVARDPARLNTELDDQISRLL
ncbi:MAG: hypothetical protein C3F08_10465 [Candidatus Methylomirabilota bacterium]|nr:MAG: hypothetical protein C3F08_10465 [candidate division NC10 bacterium]